MDTVYNISEQNLYDSLTHKWDQEDRAYYNSTYADAQAAYLAVTPTVPDHRIGLKDFELLITQGLGEALERQNKRVAFLAKKDSTGLTDTQIQQALWQYQNAKRDALNIDFAIKLVRFYTEHIIQIETKFINMEHTKDLLANLLESTTQDAEIQAEMIKTINKLNKKNKHLLIDKLWAIQ